MLMLIKLDFSEITS